MRRGDVMDRMRMRMHSLPAKGTKSVIVVETLYPQTQVSLQIPPLGHGFLRTAPGRNHLTVASHLICQPFTSQRLSPALHSCSKERR
jgi:hypothetical protein